MVVLVVGKREYYDARFFQSPFCLSIKKTDINHIISCQHQYSMTLECQQAQKVISDQYSERFRAHKFRNVVIVSSNA
jgi:hypothetical protein